MTVHRGKGVTILTSPTWDRNVVVSDSGAILTCVGLCDWRIHGDRDWLHAVTWVSGFTDERPAPHVCRDPDGILPETIPVFSWYGQYRAVALGAVEVAWATDGVSILRGF